MQIIPLSAIPNQKFNIVLDDQNCTIHLYQRGDYLYMDLAVDGQTIRNGMICLVDISLLAYPVIGFDGMLYFADTAQAGGVPNYEQLGSRYVLFFSPASEMRAD